MMEQKRTKCYKTIVAMLSLVISILLCGSAFYGQNISKNVQYSKAIQKLSIPKPFEIILPGKGNFDYNCMYNSTTKLRTPLVHKLLLGGQLACTATDKILILVKSSSIKRKKVLREAIRTTWGQKKTLKLKNGTLFAIKVVFVMGRLPTASEQWLLGSANVQIGVRVDRPNEGRAKDLQNEYQMHRDILMGDFLDVYDSVTQKVVAGLLWAVENCARIGLIAVTDDDTVLSMWNVLGVFQEHYNLEVDSLFAASFLAQNRPVVRDPTHRWGMSHQSYSCATYPAYPLGAAYFLSSSAAQLIVTFAIQYEPWKIDDVFVGFALHHLKIPFFDISRYYWAANSNHCEVMVTSDLDKYDAQASAFAKVCSEYCKQFVINYYNTSSLVDVFDAYCFKYRKTSTRGPNKHQVELIDASLQK